MTRQNRKRMNLRRPWLWLGLVGMQVVAGGATLAHAEPPLPDEPPLLSRSTLADGVGRRLQQLRVHRDAHRARQHQALQAAAQHTLADRQPLPRAPVIPAPHPQSAPGAPR